MLLSPQHDSLPLAMPQLCVTALATACQLPLLPTTCAGTSCCAVLPLPSCPFALTPQQ